MWATIPGKRIVIVPIWGHLFSLAEKNCLRQTFPNLRNISLFPTSSHLMSNMDMESYHSETSRASSAIDAKLTGDKKLLAAARKVNEEMSITACGCRIKGNETCTAMCACQDKWRSCGIECNCHGFCCNSLYTLPNLNVRDGALGEELYTKEDIPASKVAFVVCGPIMTQEKYRQKHQKVQDKTAKHYGITVSWPGSSKGLPGEAEASKYVVDPFDNIVGAANHSCEPNVYIKAW
jgi:hypothetical protein